MLGRKPSGRSLQSAAALSICTPAGREHERTNFFIWLFRRSMFPKREAGDRVLNGSIQSTAALLVCMPAGRLGEGVKLGFQLSFRLSNFYSGRWGLRFWADLFPRLQLFRFARQRVGRVITMKTNYLRFRRSNFQERGAGGGVLGGSLPAAVGLLVYMPIGREGERAERIFYLSFHISISWPGAGRRDCGGSLKSAPVLLVSTPAGRNRPFI